MDCLIHSTYFPNLAHFVAMVNYDTVYFEIWDNYQKQTLRNRTEIYGANGKMALTVPVNYSQKNRQLYKDVKIANKNNWQKQHIKSLESAYRMSPFFEFYMDDLMPLFNKPYNYILDLNINCFEVLLDCLQINIKISETIHFEKKTNTKTDFRHLVNRNFIPNSFEDYVQVFSEKHGFISNLSILDLLFNEGPNTELYLKRQVL